MTLCNDGVFKTVVSLPKRTLTRRYGAGNVTAPCGNSSRIPPDPAAILTVLAFAWLAAVAIYLSNGTSIFEVFARLFGAASFILCAFTMAAAGVFRLGFGDVFGVQRVLRLLGFPACVNDRQPDKQPKAA